VSNDWAHTARLIAAVVLLATVGLAGFGAHGPRAASRDSASHPTAGEAPLVHQHDVRVQAKAVLDAALAKQRPDGRIEAYSEYLGMGAYISNYMAGLFWEAAILYDRLIGDPRILPAMRRWADWTWSNEWNAKVMGFRYQDVTAQEGRAAFTVAGQSVWSKVADTATAFPELNGMMMPAWGYLFLKTGDPQYAAQGDLMLKGLVRAARAQTLPKQYPQMYRSSPRYLAWTRPSSPVPALGQDGLLDVLLGPLTRAGADHDPWIAQFDAIQQELGHRWADRFPALGQTVNDANFYDLVLTIYMVYARTNDARWLTRARDAAVKVRDSYPNSVATVRVVDLHDWSIGGSVPNGRTRASLGLAIHALESGDGASKRIVFYKGEHAARSAGSKSWWATANPVFPYADGRECAGEWTALLTALALGYEGPFVLPGAVRAGG
jgi:hypothetical protein